MGLVLKGRKSGVESRKIEESTDMEFK